MIIDSKGKLFGKISIIDILILAVIIAGAAGVWHMFFRSSGGTVIGRTPDTVVFKFYGEEAPDYAVEAVKIGDLARDFDRGTSFGNVTDIVTGESVIYVETADGKVVQSSTPNYSSYYFTVEGTGTLNDVGTVTIGGYEYAVGRTLTLRFGKTVVQGRIYIIDKKE